MAYTKLDYKDLNKWVSENYRFKKDFIDDLWNTVGFMCIHQSDVYDHMRAEKDIPGPQLGCTPSL